MIRLLKKYLTSGPLLAIELLGENCIDRWRQLIGPKDSAKARKDAPTSLRACYGEDSIKNAVHGAEDRESAEKVRNIRL